MLDKTTIGDPEPRKPLQCELCLIDYNDNENYKFIDDTGYCSDCYKD